MGFICIYLHAESYGNPNMFRRVLAEHVLISPQIFFQNIPPQRYSGRISAACAQLGALRRKRNAVDTGPNKKIEIGNNEVSE